MMVSAVCPFDQELASRVRARAFVVDSVLKLREECLHLLSKDFNDKGGREASLTLSSRADLSFELPALSREQPEFDTV